LPNTDCKTLFVLWNKGVWPVFHCTALVELDQIRTVSPHFIQFSY